MNGVTHQHNLHYFPCIDHCHCHWPPIGIGIGVGVADGDAAGTDADGDADAGIKKGSSLPRRKIGCEISIVH